MWFELAYCWFVVEMFFVALSFYSLFNFLCRFFSSSSSSLSWIALFAFTIRAKAMGHAATAVNGLSCEQTAAYYCVAMYKVGEREIDWMLVVICGPWVYWNFYQRLRTCVVMIGASKTLSIFFDSFCFSSHFAASVAVAWNFTTVIYLISCVLFSSSLSSFNPVNVAVGTVFCHYSSAVGYFNKTHAQTDILLNELHAMRYHKRRTTTTTTKERNTRTFIVLRKMFECDKNIDKIYIYV